MRASRLVLIADDRRTSHGGIGLAIHLVFNAVHVVFGSVRAHVEAVVLAIRIQHAKVVIEAVILLQHEDHMVDGLYGACRHNRNSRGSGLTGASGTIGCRSISSGRSWLN